MKRKEPQPEFGFANEPIKLVGESSTDGDRVANDRTEDHRRISAERAQSWFKVLHTTVDNAPEYKPT